MQFNKKRDAQLIVCRHFRKLLLPTQVRTYTCTYIFPKTRLYFYSLLIKFWFYALKIHCYATPTAVIATASVFGSLMEILFDYSHKVSARTPSKIEMQYNTSTHAYIHTQLPIYYIMSKILVYIHVRCNASKENFVERLDKSLQYNQTFCN